MSSSDRYWGDGRAVYRRPDVPANSAPGEGVVISSDADHARVSAAVRSIYAAARAGQAPTWLTD